MRCPELCLVILIALGACTDEGSVRESPLGEGTLLIKDATLDQSLPDIPLIEPTVPDASQLPSEEYQDRCWRSQFWHCPPFEEVWRVEVVVDTCDEFGNPCTPEEIADPDCQWRIVTERDCAQYHECDPSDLQTSVQPCETEDGERGLVSGQQEVQCNKGEYVRGACLPCVEETCDLEDNDCDGVVDEGFFPCEGLCGPGVSVCIEGSLQECTSPEPIEEVCDDIDNDCDGSVDEGQLNSCGLCGHPPADVCDGQDNDCDGSTDEDLIALCETACEEGVQFCVEGQWSACTAQQPQEERCDLEDNDCDGRVDEDADCSCPPDLIGALLPCLEPPLLCGQGFRGCECIDAICSATAWTECQAPCVVLNQEPCDPAMGIPLDEMCNNYDDNCNTLIDEELARTCYSGPEGTLGVGLCAPGNQLCSRGRWGGEINNSFIGDACIGETIPTEELCNGEDDNCDGVTEEDLNPTDIVFIVDVSGSMSEEIQAVQGAMAAFSASFQGSPAIRWGLVVGPVGAAETLVLVSQPVPFGQFIPELAAVRESNSGLEMLRDALYLCARNLVPLGVIPQGHANLRWSHQVGGSDPPLAGFNISWRDDADRVIIVFTDEEAQSYLNPVISSRLLVRILGQSDRLSVHIFSSLQHRDQGNDPWGPLTVGGAHHELTFNQEEMFMSMMEIIDDEVCGNGN